MRIRIEQEEVRRCPVEDALSRGPFEHRIYPRRETDRPPAPSRSSRSRFSRHKTWSAMMDSAIVLVTQFRASSAEFDRIAPRRM